MHLMIQLRSVAVADPSCCTVLFGRVPLAVFMRLRIFLFPLAALSWNVFIIRQSYVSLLTWK
jgi:hypothetical protein